MRHTPSRRAVWPVLTLLALPLVAVGLLAPPASAAGTGWGHTGATYSGGIVCHLPGATTVPMTRWSVDGIDAFATTDVVARGGVYGPAPSSGASSPMVAGQAGLSDAQIAAVAYLIDHHGSGSAAQVAETSADVAAAAGDGSAQAQCLGQHGTNAQHAATLWARAQRFAGPYTVSVPSPGPTIPGARATVTAKVLSAAGAGAPGIRVTFTTGSGSATATTGADGVARARMTTPVTSRSPITATASESTGLVYYASNPPAVGLAAPSDYLGSGSFGAALAPKPTVSVSSARLVLESGAITPVAHVSGTNGYSGDGMITIAGPVQPGNGTDCSSLTAADFRQAPAFWTGAFNFSGDGAHPTGTVRSLPAGCFAATATATTTNSLPPVRTASTVDPHALITVSSIKIAASSATGVAGRGPLNAVVTASGVGRATVSSSVTEFGPLASSNGQCGPQLDWSSAPAVGTSAPVALAAASSASSASPAPAAGSLTATIPAPAVSGLGCYALATRTVITQEDGNSLAVRAPVGGKGTTTMVVHPTVALSNGSYDGQQGKPMTGTITISGAFGFAGKVDVGLLSAPTPAAGCHTGSFSGSPVPGEPTKVSTTGDGTYAFETPTADRNRCYAVTATLSLDANSAVLASAPAPSASTTFLAGVVLRADPGADVPSSTGNGLFRAAVAFGLAYALILIIAGSVVIGAAVQSRTPPQWPASRSIFFAAD